VAPFSWMADFGGMSGTRHYNIQEAGAISTPYRIAASSIATFIFFNVVNLMQYPVTLALPNLFPYVWAKYALSLIPRI
jgi:hypothetical protein